MPSDLALKFMNGTHRVLTEGPRMGRTEQFTEVAFATDQREGVIVEATIRGQDGARLLA